jgi:hypothetical protein
MLIYGLEKKNADVIESAVPLMYKFGISKDYLNALNALALEPWHHKHEDIVFALGKLKDPSSTDVLYKTSTAHHAYLDVQDRYSPDRALLRGLAG